MILTKIWLIILFLLLIGCIYILIRCTYVYKLLNYLNEFGYEKTKEKIHSVSVKDSDEAWRNGIKEYTYANKMWNEITSISFDKLLYSFKPLKPKYWLNEEQLKFINHDRTNIN